MSSELTASKTQADAGLPFRHTFFAMIGLGLVAMLVALDQTVVSTALPSVIRELKDYEWYAWVINGYFLASVAVVPVFGRLGDLFGRKRFVMLSVLIFILASGLCALAGSMPMLVLARALQGIGGGMMVGNAFACVADLFPDPRERVRWQVVISLSFGLGTGLGPTLGGFLSEYVSWRASFIINVPVGLISLYCLWCFLPSRSGSHQKGSSRSGIDYPGAILITLILAALQLMLEWLPESGLNVINLGLILFITAAVIIFCKWEKKAYRPIIPPDLFRDRDLVQLMVLSIMLGFVQFTLLFFTPLLLQGGFGMSPRDAGMLATPLALCIALGSIFNTRLIIYLQTPFRMLTVGYLLMTAGALLFVFIRKDSPQIAALTAGALAGLGMGFIINNLNVFSQNIVGKSHFGIVTALLQSTRMTGGIIGTTLTGALVNRLYQISMENQLNNQPDSVTDKIRKAFADPQVLLDVDIQKQLISGNHSYGEGIGNLLVLGHASLTESLHYGLIITAAIALAGMLITLRLFHLRLHRSAVSAKTEST